MKSSLMMPIVAFVVFLGACGGSEKLANKGGDNTSNGNASGMNSAPVNTSPTASPANSGFVLPSPSPVEKGKPQSYTGITITVPADWKATGKKDSGTASGIGFLSPGNESEAITIYVGRSYEAQEGDMVREFTKLRKDPQYQASMPAIDNTVGILFLLEKGPSGQDILSFETFQPPDSSGYTLKRHVKFSCPTGTFEQNKQQIVNILYSAKIAN